MKKIAVFMIAGIIMGLSAELFCAESADKASAKKSQEQKTKAALEIKKPKVEVVFVLDTTGSMGGLINAAKEKIWSIANTLATSKPSPDIKMGLIGYRDRGDEYVTRVTNLTDDLDYVYSQLLDFKASGGADEPESVNQALNEAVTKMDWSKDESVFKVIYLVGDAPPHMDYENDVKYPNTCKMAAEKGIFINTIQCGTVSQTAPIWKEIALKAEGKYFRVEQSGSAILASTPYDEELSKLSIALDDTRVFYGTKAEQAEQERRRTQAEKIDKDASVSAKASRVSFNASKAGMDNFAGNKELVSDIETGKVKLSQINKDELIGKIKDMTPHQQKEHVEKLSAQRKEIQKQIQVLSEKRQQYIKDQIEKNHLDNKQSIDSALFESIQEQAAKRKIIYNDGPVY